MVGSGSGMELGVGVGEAAGEWEVTTVIWELLSLSMAGSVRRSRLEM